VEPQPLGAPDILAAFRDRTLRGVEAHGESFFMSLAGDAADGGSLRATNKNGSVFAGRWRIDKDALCIFTEGINTWRCFRVSRCAGQERIFAMLLDSGEMGALVTLTDGSATEDSVSDAEVARSDEGVADGGNREVVMRKLIECISLDRPTRRFVCLKGVNW
jgi:hypothetical protein